MKVETNRVGLRQFVKEFLEKRGDKKKLVEIKKRIGSNTLLKDLSETELQSWNKRINDVLICEDSQKIQCIKEAGTINKEGLLVMHNGLKIKPLSYYGYPVLKMLLENKGIHEPQEEYVFQEVLKCMPPGATMIELGAYWSFYSMWFNLEVKDAKNFMIEPWEIKHGINNFKINKLKGNFFQYYIGDKPGTHTDGSKIISVDSFVNEHNIDFVDILHSDIQGNELNMLNGAEKMISTFKVGYVFISTHSDELHEGCKRFMLDLGYKLVCSADMKQTFSYDGLLVFKSPDYTGFDSIEISHRIN